MGAGGEAAAGPHRRARVRARRGRGLTGRPLLWAVAREDILEDLDTFLEKDSERLAGGGLIPVESSRHSGWTRGAGARPMDTPVHGEGWPPVPLTLNDGTELRFHGLI